MSLINIQNLTFSYYGGYKNIFDDVNLRIDTDWKLGFVGRNGRGKTTFLKLLLGEYEYRGRISANVKFTYFPFTVSDADSTVTDVIAKLCPDAEEWEILREFNLLELDANVPYSLFNTLSGGEQTKALLGGLFLNKNEFLLIDEPTNHLDEHAREVVSAYLKRKSGFILVSHDRAFLDRCVDHIMSINKTNIEIQSGNFSSWLTNYECRQSYEQTQNDKLSKDIARLTESARTTSAWADKTEKSKFGKDNKSGLRPDKGFVGHKAAKLQKRATVTEARKEKAIEEKSGLLKNTEKTERLKIFPLEFTRGRIADFKDVSIFYGDREICSSVSFEIESGMRVALSGKNGSGKTSILKLIAGENVKHTGSAQIAPYAVISYVPQRFDTERGDMREFCVRHGVDETLFKTILKKTDFSADDFDRDLSALSMGQKKKIALAKSLCQRAHLYVWDEPLNYIDVFSRIQIENLIREFCPTMIFVEHDKTFTDSIATDIIPL